MAESTIIFFKNDLITLARKMTQIMHQMTEYTRGEGQLKTNKGEPLPPSSKIYLNYA